MTSAPNPVLLTESLTYTISLTNLETFSVPSIFVTNHFSASALWVTVSNSIAAPLYTNGNDMTFQISSFPAGQIALLGLVVSPREFGTLTNTVTVSYLGTNLASTNVITEVIAGQADLSVSLTGPAETVFANDWVSYTLAVTNQGPNAAPGVTVSNALPADVGLISVTVSNESVTLTDHSLIWSVGLMRSGEGANLNVTVQPTNAGSATLLANVSAPNVIETNLDNNSAQADFAISPLVPGSLVVSNVSAMVFNPQTALMEQTVRLVNIGTSTVAAARVIVSGLTNRLVNAIGTNDYHPFVVHGTALAPDQSVDLLLDYLVPTRQPVVVADSQLQAFELAAFNPALPTGTPIGITRAMRLPSGDVLIEFPATPGRIYSVLYSDEVNFTNLRAGQPSLVAPADRVQWIDYGPPNTQSRPATARARFYRVIQNQ